MVLPKCSDMFEILVARIISLLLLFLMTFLLNLPMYLAVNLPPLYFYQEFFQSSAQELPIIFPNLSDISITEEVFQTLTSLDPSKAAGCDRIGPKVLKLCAALYQPLCACNLSLNQVTDALQNYRPPVCFFQGIG